MPSDRHSFTHAACYDSAHDVFQGLECFRDSIVCSEDICLVEGCLVVPVRTSMLSFNGICIADCVKGPNVLFTFCGCRQFNISYTEPTDLKEFELGWIEIRSIGDEYLLDLRSHYILMVTARLSSVRAVVAVRVPRA